MASHMSNPPEACCGHTCFSIELTKIEPTKCEKDSLDLQANIMKGPAQSSMQKQEGWKSHYFKHNFASACQIVISSIQHRGTRAKAHCGALGFQ